MTDETQVPVQDELETLKGRAKLLGIKFHPTIGVDALREKVRTALADEADAEAEEAATPVVAEAKEEKTAVKRARLRREATRLVRVNVTCMNPNKREWQGEIFTVSNKLVGTVKRMVPFNTSDGWHVEELILKQLEQRQCQIFVTKQDSRGNKVRKGKLIKEFSIERLPSLKQKELDELARRQAMANGDSDGE